KHFQKKIEVLRKSEELKQGRARDIDLLEKPKENQMQYEENLKSHALTMDEEMVKEANAKIAYMFAILCLCGVKAVIESDKVIMSKANVFVGKAYACDGMFKLNINKITSSAYLPDCNFISSFNIECSTFNLWHNRLGHINYKTMKDMLKQGIISYSGKHKDKCQICVQAKMKRKPFPKVDRQSEILELVHSDICELNGQLTRGGDRTTPYTPQQNGVAERKNRVSQDMINAMLVSANLPKNLWGEALLIACHVSNRIIAKKLKVSPYEIWKGRKPNISYFRVWGCLAYHKVPLPNTSKLGPRGLKSVFVGYAKDSKSYRCLDLDLNVIVESRDVDLFENKFLHDSTSTNEIVTQIPQDISSPDLNSFNKRNMAESSSAPRRSERARKERNLDPDFIDSQAIIFLVEGDNKNNKEAIDDEIDSLVSNNTWKLSDLPPGSKAIGCRWVFRIKYHTDGSIQTFKARLVIQGFSQRQGVDYFDTYAPVARITSIRVLFALASIYNLPIHQMDVKTAFLNGDLDEEVYMKQPEGFVLPGHENKFTKDYGVVLCLYVDDILIVETNMERINETKKFLSSCFQMKDMNEVDTILGIKVKRHSGGYALNQCHYIDKIIDKFQHLNIEEANTPYESSCKLLENNGRAVAQIEYASAIGCLMYATHCTRHDIVYDVCKLSRYTSNPSQDHWKAIGRVFSYLKRTRQLALFYVRFPAVLEGYSYASRIIGSSDSKSTTGWIFTLGGGAVCWGSKKQTCITHSTMEAEFLALAAAGKEAEWLRNMLLDIELWPQSMPAISLHCDSQSTLSRAYNKVYNGKSRHISLRHAYIKELISSGIIFIEYIRSCKNLADPFTKGLPKEIVFGTTREMGLKPIE
ncbi:retrovirus-related pol polyprotein from transposon TNT 1-94, partial [Tanacetum coccineum]